jgi:hypothetical protein
MGHLRCVTSAGETEGLVKSIGRSGQAGFLEPSPDELLCKGPAGLPGPPALEGVVGKNSEVFENSHRILRNKRIRIP